MAQYAALWTSSRDPEFQQMKKIKQITERNLARDMAKLEKKHKKRMTHIRNEIFDTMATLTDLRLEKEKRARELLTIFFRQIRKRNIYTLRSRNQQVTKKSNEANTNHLFQSSNTVSSSTDNSTSIGTQSKGWLAMKQRVGYRTLPQEYATDKSTVETHGGATKKSTQNTEAGETFIRRIVNPAAVKAAKNDYTKQHYRLRPRMTDYKTQNCIKKHLATAKDAAAQKQQIRREGFEERKTLDIPRQHRSNKISLDTKGRILITQVFPYVYHSHGEKNCSHYSIFRECTDYDPFEESGKTRYQGSLSSQNQTDHLLSQNMRRRSTNTSLREAAIAVKAANVLALH